MNIKKCASGMLIVPFALAIGGIGSKNCWAAGSDEKVDAIKEKMAQLHDGINKHNTRPNFVTIVLDDLGFSDLSTFGSEIPTPNMDQLVNKGVMLTNFYAAPTSTPSRAMLFTGKDSHAAGVGIMASMTPKPEQLQADGKTPRPEYQGRLSLDVPTFPELLKQNGYHTMFTGKWDLSGEPPKETESSSEVVKKIWEIQEHDPIYRGFDVTRAALIPGGGYHYSGSLKKDKDGNYIKDNKGHYMVELNKTPWELQSSKMTPNLLYTENGLGMKEFSKEFYSTEYYTDMGIDMLKNRDKTKPFYLCMTYTAPHNPLQAPKEVIAKYADFYSKGWDEIRSKRFERQKELGLWPKDAKLPPMSSISKSRAWDSLSDAERKTSAKEMAVYAAMIDVLDKNIGRLVEHLKKSGQYDNTLIFLYSDNGGGYNPINTTPDIPVDDSLENIGSPNSYVGVNMEDDNPKDKDDKGFPEWAMAMNAPFVSYKGSTNEGGWHTAALLHYPKSKVSGQKSARVNSVADIAPTVLEMAGIKYPNTYKGKSNKPMAGVSMADIFEGQLEGHDERFVAFEMNGKIGVRKGEWKIVKECNKDTAQLFNLKENPFELPEKDLAKQNPEKLKELQEIYTQYAKENDIVKLGSCSPTCSSPF